MNVLDFIAHLRTLDIQLSAENGKLRINAPKGAITPEIKSELTARKAEILALLSEVETIVVEREEGELPLSLAQEHLWQLHRLTPDTIAYNMHVVLRLCGPLNVGALETAVSHVVARHQILRSSFPSSEDQQPYQVIAPASSIILEHITVPATMRADELQSLITNEIRSPFNLARGPLFRPTLVQIQPTQHVLILAMHHIISDGASFAILLDGIAHAYRAACEGASVDMQPLPLQYVDYAAWQRQWLESDSSAADRSYWQSQLTGDVPALELPLDHPHPLKTVAEGDFVDLKIEPLQDALNELCRREGVTLFAVVLTAFNTLLHRHSGQQDLLVCTPAAGRDRAELSGLIGYFNNTLLLRSDLSTIRTLRELLHESQSKVMNALAHQMFPFKEMAGFPGVVRTALSRAMVVVQNADDTSFQLSGITVEKIPAFNQAVQYDLSLEVTVASNQWNGRLMYRKVLFERATVMKLADEFVAILGEMLLVEDVAIHQDIDMPVTVRTEIQETNRLPFVAPRNDLEHRLAQVWKDVLNVERVGIHDEFFDLGGHSLLALRLFTRIEQETGTTLPLSTLFGTTTIARLAELIRGEFTNESWDCLVPIQPQGARMPFFCVHGVGGGVLGYRDLASFLEKDQPFFGLQAVGQDGRCEYDTSIKVMASRYIDVMRSQQPTGPYRIGGYCFGGVVAYEMACQLEKMGEQVSVLALFESTLSDTADSRAPVSQRLSAIWKSIPIWTKDYSGMSLTQIFNRIRATLFKIWVKFQRNPEAERRIRVEETLDVNADDLPNWNIKLTDIHMNATLQYAPEKYSGVVTLFRARNRGINEVMFGSLDPKMGWDHLAKGVRVVHVDGFHRNMHVAPYAESLARELQKVLDRDENSD